MSQPAPQEVGPVTALVSILVVLLAVFMTYSILLGPQAGPTDPAVDSESVSAAS